MDSPYIPCTPSDRNKMLAAIGVKTEEELFQGIPKKFLLNKPPQVPGPKSEFEIKELAARMFGPVACNVRNKVFLGAGIYDHYSPSIVNHLTLRGEFLTSYTPYQPEAAQGNLQALFEFQSMAASLLGMDISNASHYDGATSLADGALMALRVKKNAKKIFLSPHIHPDYIATLRTYLQKGSVEVITLKEKAGVTDLDQFKTLVKSEEQGGFVVISQSPNYLGLVESFEKIADIAKEKEGLLLTVTTEALSLGLLKSPGECGAEIAVAEGQSLGLPPSFGGPLLGLFATKEEHMRQIPGRLCGKTLDKNGRVSYVLTLSTREQHIRRAKATSNICSNQNLCALMVTIYLSLLGKKGLRELAIQNLSLTEYLKEQVRSLKGKGVNLPYNGKTFNEFVVTLPVSAEEICKKAYDHEKVVLGLPLSHIGRPNDLLVAVTETKKKADLDHWISALQTSL